MNTDGTSANGVDNAGAVGESSESLEVYGLNLIKKSLPVIFGQDLHFRFSDSFLIFCR